MAALRSRNGDRKAQKAKTIYHLPVNKMFATPCLVYPEAVLPVSLSFPFSTTAKSELPEV